MNVSTKFGEYKVNGCVYIINVIYNNGEYKFVVTNLTKQVSQIYSVDSETAETIVSSSEFEAYLELASIIKDDIKAGRI
ncbi:hypothetical protein [Rahnella sp. R3(2024)]|uniref:hypothetical protein n=1 Tax=Rahnella sp. R3(2024) TaxID=3163550 RepID=UPI0036F17A4F